MHVVLIYLSHRKTLFHVVKHPFPLLKSILSYDLFLWEFKVLKYEANFSRKKKWTYYKYPSRINQSLSPNFGTVDGLWSSHISADLDLRWFRLLATGTPSLTPWFKFWNCCCIWYMLPCLGATAGDKNLFRLVALPVALVMRGGNVFKGGWARPVVCEEVAPALSNRLLRGCKWGVSLCVSPLGLGLETVPPVELDVFGRERLSVSLLLLYSPLGLCNLNCLFIINSSNSKVFISQLCFYTIKISIQIFMINFCNGYYVQIMKVF